ncbi:hemerythrin domain-containing protein [Frankia sp. CNm7]|uniref:Hemerythrin domain-containing protein n=1 Tax=Frankia nepalensis TaxID=1836974 RepID=A0A937URT4_9ACTN|nr:hemerythrin domain-containing protein [Frankia nepalensis]MBL7497811.1 hemerythrin domain-containing protein [Frankia nepalensis]MBL7512659.1 hemerythrin domain-containing protein [Frankia nepalensis]MBL7520019.1 hemerythrin domain-containing protein [Frankia nepalensis]MBL7631712.1 hemerythrin domain-containing protein [Frankia nepalensis]
MTYTDIASRYPNPSARDLRPAPAASPAQPHQPETGRRPRRELVVFLATTFGLTAASTCVALGQSVDVSHIGDASGLGQAAMYGQAAWPLVGAAAARLSTRRLSSRRRPGGSSAVGWGWRRPSARVLGLAWAYGVAYPLLAGILLWATGLGGFDGAKLASGFGLDGLPTPLGAALAILLGLTVGCLPYLALAIGEEVGWRGVLVPHLAASNSPARVVLLGGLIWSAFHLPIIIALGGTPDGVPAPVAAALFAVALTALGSTLAWQRLRYGLWPVVVTHAAVNATLYVVVAPATVERSATGWFGTETGLLLAVTSVAAAMLWARRAPLRSSAAGTVIAATRAPGSTPETPASAPADAVSAGVAPVGAVPAGAVPSGTASAGAVSAGAVPAGVMPAGVVPISPVPAGAVPAGVVPSGDGMIDTSDMFVVHAMFRHQLGLLPDLVRGVRPGDGRRAGAVVGHLELLLTLLHEHHTGEDRVLWPRLTEREPSAATMVAAARGQHEEVARLTDEVRRVAAAWRPDTGVAARDRLAGLLEDLDVTVEEHLDDEEREVVPLAALLLTAGEWSELGRGGSARLSPRQMLLSLGMIERAAGPEGLARLTAQLPAPARPLVTRLARRTARRTFLTLTAH